MIERRSTMLPPPSVPDDDEIYVSDLTPLENLAVWEDEHPTDVSDFFLTVPAPPPDF